MQLSEALKYTVQAGLKQVIFVEGITLTNLVEKALINYLPKETIIKKILIGPNSDP